MRILLISACGLAASAVVSVAWGATYNFYFNNTEQGDHSTATPSLTVSDGKAQKSDGGPQPASVPVTAASPLPGGLPAMEPEKPADPSTATNPLTPLPANPSPASAGTPGGAAASGSGVSSAELATLGASEPRSTHRWLRFGMGALLMGEEGTRTGYNYSDYYYGSPGYTYNTRGNDGGGLLSLALFPTRSLGVNVYGGAYRASIGGADRARWFAGADLEILPLHISIGKLENFIEGGFLAGASSIRASHDNIATAHVGARLNFNFGERWTLSAAGRGNLGYIMGEAGFAYHM